MKEGLTPTVKLRWLVVKNSTTNAEIERHAEANWLTWGEAKKRLINAQPAVLQQWISIDGADDSNFGFWEAVPVVVEPHDAPDEPT